MPLADGEVVEERDERSAEESTWVERAKMRVLFENYHAVPKSYKTAMHLAIQKMFLTANGYLRTHPYSSIIDFLQQQFAAHAVTLVANIQTNWQQLDQITTAYSTVLSSLEYLDAVVCIIDEEKCTDPRKSFQFFAFSNRRRLQ